jgi:hypothetical protein
VEVSTTPLPEVVHGLRSYGQNTRH